MDNPNNNAAADPRNLSSLEGLSQYLKDNTGAQQGRSIPPLESWHPTTTSDMDLTIKANGEWWHEGTLMTRQSLVDLFATILWREDKDGTTEYFLKTPVQKLRIKVEDAPLLINDVGIVQDDGVSWLEFTTTTGDIVRLDQAHPIELRPYSPELEDSIHHDDAVQMRPYMPVRNGLTALIGRNTFYHLTQIGTLSQEGDTTTLTLMSGGEAFTLSMKD